jgi:hypothetical protein
MVGFTYCSNKFSCIISINSKKCLPPFIKDFTLCYLDDNIICSKSELEYIDHVTKVLKALEVKNIFVILEKSEFHINNTIFLD